MKEYLSKFEPIAKEMGLEIVSYNIVSSDIMELSVGLIGSFDSPDLETLSKAASMFAESIDYEIGLDVSSPGAEREISPDDYEANIGKYIYVDFKNPAKGMDEVEGELEEVDDTFVSVRYRVKHTSKVVQVERDNIKLLRIAVKV